MHLYRIGPEQYLRNMSGLGASYRDGARWNLPGLPAVYFGLSPSVAMLEMANYLPSPRLVPKSYRLAQYEIQGADYDQWTIQDLPSDWNSFPHAYSTQNLGSEWLKQNQKLLLILPSAAVPAGLENIALFNPNHPDAANISLLKSLAEIYSERMFRGG